MFFGTLLLSVLCEAILDIVTDRAPVAPACKCRPLSTRLFFFFSEQLLLTSPLLTTDISISMYNSILLAEASQFYKFNHPSVCLSTNFREPLPFILSFRPSVKERSQSFIDRIKKFVGFCKAHSR